MVDGVPYSPLAIPIPRVLLILWTYELEMPFVVTTFRDWLAKLRKNEHDPDCPYRLYQAIHEEYLREREICRRYESEVFINRDEYVKNHKSYESMKNTPWSDEKKTCFAIYDYCHNYSGSHGILNVNGQPHWLVGVEWPTQGGNQEKGRKADLVGIRTDGGLAVFEAKRTKNNDWPLTALMEGLDYLSCLTCPSNYAIIEREFKVWFEIKKDQRSIPPGFETTTLSRDSTQAVILLAPSRYYNEHWDYPLIRKLRGDMGNWKSPKSVYIEFAFMDSISDQAHLRKV
jgi:hypothetical protein